jgi:hypothetical protein
MKHCTSDLGGGNDDRLQGLAGHDVDNRNMLITKTTKNRSKTVTDELKVV